MKIWGVLSGGGVRFWRGPGGCEQRIEVIVKMLKNVWGGSCRVGGSGRGLESWLM